MHDQTIAIREYDLMLCRQIRQVLCTKKQTGGRLRVRTSQHDMLAKGRENDRLRNR